MVVVVILVVMGISGAIAVSGSSGASGGSVKVPCALKYHARESSSEKVCNDILRLCICTRYFGSD